MEKLFKKLFAIMMITAIFLTAISPVYFIASTILLRDILPEWFMISNYVISGFITFFMIFFLVLFLGRSINNVLTKSDDESDDGHKPIGD